LQITHEKLAIQILLKFLLPQPVPTSFQGHEALIDIMTSVLSVLC